jgi:hypothetical protein
MEIHRGISSVPKIIVPVHMQLDFRKDARDEYENAQHKQRKKE